MSITLNLGTKKETQLRKLKQIVTAETGKVVSLSKFVEHLVDLILEATKEKLK